MDFIMHQLMVYIDGHPEESTYKALASQMLDSIEQLHSMTIYEMADRFFCVDCDIVPFLPHAWLQEFFRFQKPAGSPVRISDRLYF